MELVELPMLYTEDGKKLLEFLQKHPDFTGQPEKAKELQNLSDYVKIESLLYEELYQGLELTELHYEAARLQARLVEQFVKNQKQNIAHALDGADDKAIAELLERARGYDALLKQVQGGRSGQEEPEAG